MVREKKERQERPAAREGEDLHVRQPRASCRAEAGERGSAGRIQRGRPLLKSKGWKEERGRSRSAEMGSKWRTRRSRLLVTAGSIFSYGFCCQVLRLVTGSQRAETPLAPPVSLLDFEPAARPAFPSSPRNPTAPLDGHVLACSAPSPRFRLRSQKPASALQSADRRLCRPQQRRTRESERPRPSTLLTRPLRVGRRIRSRQTAARPRLQQRLPRQRSRSSHTSTWARKRTTWCCSSVRASAALSLFSPVPALRGLVCTKLTSSHVSSAASMLTKLIAHNDQVPLSTCVSCHFPGSCGWLVLTTRVPPSFPNPNIETTSLASTRALRQASLSSSICAESCATRTSRCVLKQLVRWETCVLGPRLTPFPLQRRPRSPEISPPHPPPLPRHLLRPLSELHSVLPDRSSVPHLLGLCGQ